MQRGTRVVSDSFLVRAPPDRVAKALCSPAYYDLEARERKDVQSVRFVQRGRAEGGAPSPGQGEVRFEVHYTEYRRTMLGRLDRRGTVQAVVRYTFVPRRRELSWVYEGGAAPSVGLRGVYRLQPHEQGTRILWETHVEVKMKLVGGKVALVVERELRREMAAVAGRLERHLHLAVDGPSTPEEIES